MDTGWRYRLASVLGVAVLTAVGVVAVNNGTVQTAVTSLPILSRLPTDPPSGVEFSMEVLLSVAVITGVFLPLYKPQPRRILDIIALAHKRVLVGVFALATIGYFDYTYRLPRLTLLLLAPILLFVLPLWFIWLRQPDTRTERAVVVGDDPSMIERIVEAYDGSMLGYVTPPTPYRSSDDLPDQESYGVTDGGQASSEHGYVGGLSRFEDVIQKHGADSAILAFEGADRAEFFGALHTCYEHGINAKTHVDHVNSLLVNPTNDEGPIVDIDLEPWDVQDRMLKRLFDVLFAGTALLVLSPIILLITVAIKIEGHGPVFFTQERTYKFGNTFTVYKFRTLKPVDEDVDLDIDGSRRTTLGDFLRVTHLDEIPQLWSILTGEMSVVGPRPAITELESDYESQVTDWRQRWFVKPGLTGLAQINDATGKEPQQKLRYDIEYIRKQSFTYDIQIVLRQIWKVLEDVWGSLYDN
ncbi:sugar transferase [Haloplanus halophilus]|uniref:sugar transferase n=1 Tax=Haloplanus halophilus TaxID=2949993 RepID=UPI00203DC5F1|nr:sugar transferase [Haloplanus sp. GDY1]